jgi:hypothetical protein
MKRRDFLKKTLLASAFVTVVGRVAGLANTALASVTWVAAGKLGYKEAAPANMVAAKKQCSTCKYYNADGKGGADAGKCTLPAMKGGYVKGAGYCNMWMKKA